MREKERNVRGEITFKAWRLYDKGILEERDQHDSLSSIGVIGY